MPWPHVSTFVYLWVCWWYGDSIRSAAAQYKLRGPRANFIIMPTQVAPSTDPTFVVWLSLRASNEDPQEDANAIFIWDRRL